MSTALAIRNGKSHSDHPRNFKLISKFSSIRPVFPDYDYLSISYDYGTTNTMFNPMFISFLVNMLQFIKVIT